MRLISLRAEICGTEEDKKNTTSFDFGATTLRIKEKHYSACIAVGFIGHPGNNNHKTPG